MINISSLPCMLRVVTNLITCVELRTQIIFQVVVDLLISSEQRRGGPQLLNI